MKRQLSTLGLILLILVMSSCAPATKTRYREGDNRGQKISISVKDEQAMTRKVLPTMKKDYPPAKDPKLQAYITRLGNKLVNASKLNGRPYQYSFTVVDVDAINAFALPAGTVFVTLPLIGMADSEAELAGVIGHEIGHVTARHTAERMYKAQTEQKTNTIITASAGIVGAALGYGIGKMVCKKGDDKCLMNATKVGVVTGAGGSLLIQKYRYMANSREDEMEADRIGFRISTKAGFLKNDVGKFFEKLLVMEQKRNKKTNVVMKSLSDAMSTHPPSKERVEQMNEMVRKMPRQKNAIVSSNEFLKIKKIVSSRLAKSKKK